MAPIPIDPVFRQKVIAEFTADWQFWVREDGSLEYFSPDCLSISGWAREDFLSGRVRLKDYIHPDDYQAMKAHYHLGAAGKEGRDIEFRLVRKDGRILWCSVSYVPIRDDDGRLWGFRGSVRDITPRKAAEQAVLRERNMLDSVVSSIGAGLTLLDGSRRVLWYNTFTSEALGPLAENRGKACYEVFERRDAPCADCPVEVAMATGKTARTLKLGLTVPGWPPRDLVIVAVPVARAEGETASCLEIVLDITDERRQRMEKERLRDQLIRAQKMEAIGQLAGGIAHEFNNYLGGILGIASVLRMQAGSGSPQEPQIRALETLANRASELTKQLLGFARKGKPRIRQVNPNEVASSVLAIVRQTFDRAIAIREELAPDVWSVDGDPGQLEQTLLNLCINARDAMPSGGTIVMSSRNVELLDGNRGLAASEGLAPGPYVRVTVADSGTGIAPEVLGRIFEPYFTTKEPGKGTGMGLALAYGIVRSHGGIIDVETGPGLGAEFHVYLPARSS